MGDRTWRGLAVFAAASVVAAVAATPASTDVVRAGDPDDAPGRLDVRRLSHGHRQNADTGHRLLTHTLATHEAWRPRILRNGGQIELWFDVDDDAEFERRLWIGVTRGSLYAEMDGGSEVGTLGYAKVWRPGPRSVKVQFPESLLGAPVQECDPQVVCIPPAPDAYRWYATTTVVCQETDHVRVLCSDYAPARGTRGNSGRLTPLTHQLL